MPLTRSVPKPSPGVFEITKKFHNTLQGVNDLNLRISQKDKQSVRDWVTDNAERYWLSEGGPLRPTIEGGADIIIVRLPIAVENIPFLFTLSIVMAQFLPKLQTKFRASIVLLLVFAVASVLS
jgi:hypothetical protein